MQDPNFKKKIETEEDFVVLKRFDYSLKKTLEHYPDGCPDRVIAQALMLREDELDEVYSQIVKKLRLLVGEE